MMKNDELWEYIPKMDNVIHFCDFLRKNVNTGIWVICEKIVFFFCTKNSSLLALFLPVKPSLTD